MDLHTDKRGYRPKTDLSCQMTDLRGYKSINQSFITYYRSYGLEDLYGIRICGAVYIRTCGDVCRSILYYRAILQTLRICVAVHADDTVCLG